MRKVISIFVLFAFLANGLIPQTGWAQEITLPKPGVMVHLSPEFTPALLKGIVIHPENAFKFDFIVYKGDKGFTETQKKEEYTKLIKYFLASLAVPDEDQWVNLSPYEKNRIIKDDFGKTTMGRDLLSQDYLLKQITASLIYPQDKLGRRFWDEVYSRAYKQFGTTNIPVNTFNKVWIVPDEADIYEKGNIAYLYKSHLKVMLEEDYLSLSHHVIPAQAGIHSIGSQIVREIVLPQLEKEVNENKNFAPLRQVFSGMILAAWYKRALRESLLARIYANKAKLKGVDQNPQNNEAIYQQYLKAYKKGVFNYIKEDVDKYTNETIPRKYFSGGWAAPQWDGAMGVLHRHKDKLAAMETTGDLAQLAAGVDFATVSFDPNQAKQPQTKTSNAAMIIQPGEFHNFINSNQELLSVPENRERMIGSIDRLILTVDLGRLFMEAGRFKKGNIFSLPLNGDELGNTINRKLLVLIAHKYNFKLSERQGEGFLTLKLKDHLLSIVSDDRGNILDNMRVFLSAFRWTLVSERMTAEKEKDAAMRAEYGTGPYASTEPMEKDLPRDTVDLMSAIAQQHHFSFSMDEQMAVEDLMTATSAFFIKINKNNDYKPVKSWAIAFGSLLMAENSGLIREKKDMLVVFLAALFQDLYDLDIWDIDETLGLPQKMDGAVLWYLLDIISLSGQDRAKEPKYKLITKIDKTNIVKPLRKLISKEDLYGIYPEISLVMRRSETQSNFVFPLHYQQEIGKIRDDFDNRVVEGVPMDVLERRLNSRYMEVIDAIGDFGEHLEGHDQQTTHQRMREHYLKEKDIMDSLAKIPSDRRSRAYEIAQTGEFCEWSVLAWLGSKGNQITEESLVYLPQLLTPKALGQLRKLPFEFRVNFFKNVEHLAALSQQEKEDLLIDLRLYRDRDGQIGNEIRIYDDVKVLRSLIKTKPTAFTSTQIHYLLENRRIEREEHNAGFTFIREGMNGRLARDCYIIVKGEVEVIKRNGKRVPLGVGKIVGELAPLLNIDRNADVRTLEDTVFYRIPKEYLLGLYLVHDGFHEMLNTVATEHVDPEWDLQKLKKFEKSFVVMIPRAQDQSSWEWPQELKEHEEGSTIQNKEFTLKARAVLKQIDKDIRKQRGYADEWKRFEMIVIKEDLDAPIMVPEDPIKDKRILVFSKRLFYGDDIKAIQERVEEELLDKLSKGNAAMKAVDIPEYSLGQTPRLLNVFYDLRKEPIFVKEVAEEHANASYLQALVDLENKKPEIAGSIKGLNSLVNLVDVNNALNLPQEDIDRYAQELRLVLDAIAEGPNFFKYAENKALRYQLMYAINQLIISQVGRRKGLEAEDPLNSIIKQFFWLFYDTYRVSDFSEYTPSRTLKLFRDLIPVTLHHAVEKSVEFARGRDNREDRPWCWALIFKNSVRTIFIPSKELVLVNGLVGNGKVKDLENAALRKALKAFLPTHFRLPIVSVKDVMGQLKLEYAPKLPAGGTLYTVGLKKSQLNDEFTDPEVFENEINSFPDIVPSPKTTALIRFPGKKVADGAQTAVYGGIDMNAAHLDLHIKRDGNGIPLPVSQQDLDNIRIDGLVPVILEIRPAASSPLLAQLTAVH